MVLPGCHLQDGYAPDQGQQSRQKTFAEDSYKLQRHLATLSSCSLSLLTSMPLQVQTYVPLLPLAFAER